MNVVRPKKNLGQHFLTDINIARKIVESLSDDSVNVLEIGSGTGVLTQFLFANTSLNFIALDIDIESIDYLIQHFPGKDRQILHADFLKCDPTTFFDKAPFSIIGNFPYNISSQILFKVLQYRDSIPEVVGMVQKEVAERLAAPPGSKTYGILSVLLQAWYQIDYLFTVNEQVFNPPPKVKSAVIRLRRNQTKALGCDERLFVQLVKMTFNQRRKMIRNSLKGLTGDAPFSHPFLTQRPEQLSVADFVDLTNALSNFKQH